MRTQAGPRFRSLETGPDRDGDFQHTGTQTQGRFEGRDTEADSKLGVPDRDDGCKDPFTTVGHR